METAGSPSVHGKRSTTACFSGVKAVSLFRILSLEGCIAGQTHFNSARYWSGKIITVVVRALTTSIAPLIVRCGITKTLRSPGGRTAVVLSKPWKPQSMPHAPLGRGSLLKVRHGNAMLSRRPRSVEYRDGHAAQSGVGSGSSAATRVR